jgi:hypothetical protein
VSDNTLKNFANRIKPELNLLYTVPPFKLSDSLDCGWFCREHAFHCFVLCKMLKMPASIIRGDFIVHTETGLTDLCSLDCANDHAWCQVGEVCPVDLSATFALFGGGQVVVGPQLSSAVCGCGKNGDFTVTYTKDESEFRKSVKKPEIATWFGLLERERLNFPANDLIDNPFLFLHRPQKDGWAEIHGANIFSKISLHLYKLFRGEVNPLHTNHSPKTALSAIKARYGAATQKIKRIIES